MSADETESITLLRNRLARISELIDDLESLKGRILLLESQRLEIQEHMKNLKV